MEFSVRGSRRSSGGHCGSCRAAAVVAVVGMLVSGCVRPPAGSEGETPEPTEVWPTATWPQATPESQGFDSVLLADALQAAADTGRLHSLFVARNGHAVLEAYAYPYPDGLYHDLTSVTKSVLTTLVGIAADAGELDLDAPIVSFFPDRDIADRDDKTAITVRHLATMTAGQDCTNVPREDELRAMQASPDFVGFALDLPVVAEPGSRWSYCSPGMHVLSAILQQATGASALDYATDRLFGPLGIEDVYWPADPQGVSHGWGDLAMHPRDAAKLGLLLLRRGEWDGRQIVSAKWIDEATTAQTATTLHEDYGYGWYVAPPSEDIAYVRADGSGGQRILVVPTHDLVVVTTGADLDANALLEAVFAAITDEGRPLADNPAGVADLEGLLADLASGPAALAPSPPPPIAGEVTGRDYVFVDNVLGLTSLRLEFDDPSVATLTLAMRSEAVPRVDQVGLDGRFRPSVGGRPIVARGAWADAETFVIEVDEGPGVHSYEVRVTFDGDDATLEVLGATLLGSAAPRDPASTSSEP